MDDKIYLFQQQQTRSTPMNSARQILLGGMLAAAVMAVAPSAWTQQINGTPGSPDATVTIDGKHIPPSPMPFRGVIKESVKDSKPYWPPRVVAPKGAPNILLIMTDDQGYGISSTFGGVIPTPAMDRVAKAGLRYTQFHSTALCSPTRAALITGRNHHTVGAGVVGELATGYPGYDSIIGPEHATIGEILKENGYATSWFGKEHNTPTFQYSLAGPYDQWPSGMGFEYFYGFMGGETDQWTPYLFRDHTQIFPWIGRKDYNLTTDMADEAVKYLHSMNAVAPDKPFFLYYVPGGTHSPHQPTKEWIAKIHAMHLFDNGTSPEGTLEGTYNTLTAYNGILTLPEPLQLLHYEDWGSDKTYPHMAVGWTWAFDTPFKWTKQVASHFGGTRQGMAISWPGHISDVGGIHTQFHHIIDIVPTLLEATGIKAPELVNGIPQKPIEGVSMAYTFDTANAKAPSKHETQYFEMVGNRAIYHDGWVAATTPPVAPWMLGATMPALGDYHWELYNIAKDFSENNDLAAQQPDKLKEMQALFLTEAGKYQVFPLDNSGFVRVLAPKPSAIAGKTEFTYTGVNAGIPFGNAPGILDKDYTITAEITVPKGGAEGMIVTLGGRFGGYGMFLQKGKPVFVYNLLDMERFRWEGGVGGRIGADLFGRALAPGKHTLVFNFKYDGPGPGKGGTGVFAVDGKEMASKKIAHTIPFIMTVDETFDIGLDTGTGVDNSYQLPFKFTGTIDKLIIKLGPSQMSAADKIGRAHV